MMFPLEFFSLSFNHLGAIILLVYSFLSFDYGINIKVFLRETYHYLFGNFIFII